MRIFYQSPISRDWICQRPHFIAEGLAKEGHRVFWFYAGNFLKTRFRRFDDGKGFCGLELPVLPFASRCRMIEWINHCWVAWWLRNVAPDVVVMTHPVVLPWLSRRIAACPILYDCMDIQPAFFTGCRRKRMEETEKELVGVARYVVASSDVIRDNLISSYGVLPSRITVIPNGVRLSKDSNPARVDVAHPSIAYFGTVSSWFDWESVRVSALKYPEWTFDMFGPVDGVRPNMPRNVRFHGTIPHEQVYAHARNANVLIMPFVRSELVDGVDPVKMYEYLGTGRPIVTSWWPSLEKFRRFEAVHFYGGEVPLSAVLEKVVDESKTYQMPTEFLAESTWHKRCHAFSQILRRFMPVGTI